MWPHGAFPVLGLEICIGPPEVVEGLLGVRLVCCSTVGLYGFEFRD